MIVQKLKYFLFNIRSKLGTWEIFEPENLIQKRKPVTPENQLGRGVQSTSIRDLGAEPPVCSVGAKAHKNGEFIKHIKISGF